MVSGNQDFWMWDDVAVSNSVEGYPEIAISMYLTGKILMNHHFGAPFVQTKPYYWTECHVGKSGKRVPCMLPAT